MESRSTSNGNYFRLFHGPLAGKSVYRGQWEGHKPPFASDSINTLRPRQNGRHFADDVFKCIFLNGNLWISIKISLKFVPKGPINNIPALVQIMAWRRPGDKPIYEQMMVRLPTHICVNLTKHGLFKDTNMCIYTYTYIYERCMLRYTIHVTLTKITVKSA